MRLLPWVWPRPSDAAVATFRHAMREAKALSGVLGPEHLLVAVIECGALSRELLDDYGIVPDDLRDRLLADERTALAALGISLDSVHREVEETFGPGAWKNVRCVAASPEAKRALALAQRVARRFRHARLEPEHLLLALLRQHGRARMLLADLGVPVLELEDRVCATLAWTAAR